MDGCYDSLGNRVDVCLDKYRKEHGKFPNAAVLTENVYDLFAKNNLLTLPSRCIGPDETDEENERTYLQNTAGELIVVYRIDRVPAKIRHQLNQQGIKLPLHLCRAGLVRKIDKKSIDSFNLEATVSELALV